MMDMHLPIFVRSDLEDVLSPDVGPLHVWVADGSILPTVRSRGTGSPHLFSGLGLFQGAAIGALVAQGVSISEAACVVYVEISNERWSELFLVFDKDASHEAWVLVARRKGEPDQVESYFAKESDPLNLGGLCRLMARGGGKGVQMDDGAAPSDDDSGEREDWYRVTPYPIGSDLGRAMLRLRGMYERKTALRR